MLFSFSFSVVFYFINAARRRDASQAAEVELDDMTADVESGTNDTPESNGPSRQ